MRRIRLPSGRVVILSDTVGFISELPTELVAAFRATLEEVLEADLILHVRDISHPDTEAQKKDVEQVLVDLGLKEQVDAGLKEVLNKIDLLSIEEQKALHELNRSKDLYWPVSALTGEGISALLTEVERTLFRDDRQCIVRVAFEDGKTLAWLYEKGRVIRQTELENEIEVEVYLSERDFRVLVDRTPELVFIKA